MKISAFRADIEGLRAISITAVVFYHARLSGFSGGFVGVDIFFVISGFLITGLLLKEIERNQSINLLAFWARRARRLLPNALLTLTATLIVVALLLPEGGGHSAIDHRAAEFGSDFLMDRIGGKDGRYDDEQAP